MTTTENMFELPSHIPGANEITTQSQGRTVKGGGTPSRSDANGALDWPGLGRTLPIEGPGNLARPLNFTNELQPADGRQSHPLTGADITESGDTMTDNSLPRGPGLFKFDNQPGGRHIGITNIRRIAGKDIDAGSQMIAVATGCLAVLIGGLMAVNYAAQHHWLFTARAENWPTIIEALALDVAFILFSALGLGLAKKGLPARTERAAAAGCAAGQAFMNYLASNGSVHSIAAYVMPSLLLAVAADRVIAVVRRWTIGEAEPSQWHGVAKGLGLVTLYVLRLFLAPIETSTGVRRIILNAAPLPSAEVVPVAAIEPPADDEEVPEIPAYASKKDHLLAVYRNHPNYGERRFASRAASELAPGVGLQAGTARTYLYDYLSSIEQDGELAS